jgi:NAD(P)H-dependent flavin oxidoreductase YrpB (nitropropane dioxygenase family)
MKALTIGDLKARIPIIQGGMGVGISLSGLASAVANEGGIGVISAAGLGLLYKKLSPNYTEAGNLGLIEEIRKGFPSCFFLIKSIYLPIDRYFYISSEKNFFYI